VAPSIARPRPLAQYFAAALAIACFVTCVWPADAQPATAAGSAGGTARAAGYAYAGYQATGKAYGVRAVIAAVGPPIVSGGHVAGWIGLGGPGQGPGGTDMWIQAGLASVPGMGTFLYTEIVSPYRSHQVLQLEHNVLPGEERLIAVVEMARRPGHWRIWVNGRPVTAPIALPGSSGRWAPIATAESRRGRGGASNSFAVRFEGVSVALRRGGGWAPFERGHRFSDRGSRLRSLTPAAVAGPAASWGLGGAAECSFLAAVS
jgi:hypothetical protein